MSVELHEEAPMDNKSIKERSKRRPILIYTTMCKEFIRQRDSKRNISSIHTSVSFKPVK
jgi:hypothetical protein